MPTLLGTDKPILFLGLADHVQSGPQPFPIGGLDLFQLARHKVHLVYPAMIASASWVFLVDVDFVQSPAAIGMVLRVLDANGTETLNCTFQSLETASAPPTPSAEPSTQATAPGQPIWTVLEGSPFVLFNIIFEGVLPKPGEYTITASYQGKTDEVGRITFHYRPTPSLTPDQVKAVEADVGAAKSIRFELGCKFCAKKLRAYTGLSRHAETEKAGITWYAELEDEFVCQCGKTQLPLQYLRESMHALLLKDFSVATSGLSYVRQYGHTQITAVAERFKQLLRTETLEAPIQTFLEYHPVLLARFHAKRLFVKPNIVGRFQADFAILDSQNELWFIELERPTMPLFKSNGHPTAALMHAYGQVNDWLQQYHKYPGAIQEALKLRPDDIVAVRGAVIAGHSAPRILRALQRHYATPPYPSIEFLTFDDLASSLITLSRKLA
ncbi:MAG TPA: Shedu anti-phage system protein SduA domain-containing protein [Burkholderiales bacterium]|nr:Shedu anti-phage system protein SduA domain-containing protein [Burkholderiales bacterium]